VAVAEIISGLELIKSLVDWFRANRTEALGRVNEDAFAVHRALSTLHFGEAGILGVLRGLALGAPLRPSDRAILLDFRYAGPDVGLALRRLAEAYSDVAGLSLKQRKDLLGLVPLKTAVRGEVARLFAEETRLGENVRPADAAALVTRIEDLNGAMEILDERLPR
jgi:hypothetical protein